jgi:hypothetical protein
MQMLDNNDNGTNVARATKANFSARLAGLANKPARDRNNGYLAAEQHAR